MSDEKTEYVYPPAMGYGDRGMTLRDKLAESAMVGLLAHPVRPKSARQDTSVHDDIATEAYRIADAMLKARKV